MKRALLVGASGLVGGHVLDFLLASPQYSHVTSLGRRRLPVEHPKLEQRVVSFEGLEAAEDGGKFDDVFCCLGTTIKKAGSKPAFRKVDYEYPLAVAQWALKKGARHYLLVSALGASAGSPFFYSQVKGRVEASLENLPFEQLSILQPSLLLGERREFRLGEKAAAWFFRCFSWAFVGRARKYRAIRALSVGRTMYVLAQTRKLGTQRYASDLIEKIACKAM